MPYEYKFNKDYKSGALSGTDLPKDLCCRGCGQRCEFLIKLTVRAGFNNNTGVQGFLIIPEMYVGKVRLGRLSSQSHNAQTYKDGAVSLRYSRANEQYRQALEYCHKTCKHSKLR